MAQLDFKKIAQEVAKKESGKKEVNIAQISEILKITFEILAQYPLLDISNFLDKYR